MVMIMKPSYSWWFDSHNSPRQSRWLSSTLAELDEKTKAMLKLIEQDADSFAQRAEMYYKKRPELVNMVEDFYRAHRSLAERYDQLKSDIGTRHATPLGSPLSVKSWSQKPTYPMDKLSRASSVSFDAEEPEVVDTPQEEAEVNSNTIEVPDKESGCGVVKVMREEIERLKEESRRLKEENRSLVAELIEKDEEKREAIKQLCLSLDFLKEDNVDLRKYIIQGSPLSVKSWTQKLPYPMDNSSRVSPDFFDAGETEVDDPQQEEAEVNSNTTEVSDKESGCGVVKLMSEEIERLKEEIRSIKGELIEVVNLMSEEIERFKEENKSLKAELIEKDEEKREAIRQLCLSIDILREDNVDLRKYIKGSKKWGLFDFKKLKKDVFAGKLFCGHSKVQSTTVVGI